MSLGSQLYDLLDGIRRKNPDGKLLRSQWIAVTDSFIDRNRPAKKPRAPKNAGKMTDEEWIASLEKEEIFAGVDIKRELGRAQFWAKNNNRQATRRFFVNWLMKAKADGTITMNAAGQSSRKLTSPDIYVEPAGWQEVAARLYPENAAYFSGRAWLDIAPDYRKAIVKEML